MIEIQQPELEALIHQRLESSGFDSVEELLLDALKDAPAVAESPAAPLTGTGADIIAAFQRFPLKDLEIDFDSYRGPMPVRLFTFED